MDYQGKQKTAILHLMVILFLTAMAMAFSTPFDQQVSAWLRSHNSYLLWSFMSPSIFELEPMGAGDLTIITLIFVLIGYLLSIHYERKSKTESINISRFKYFPSFFNSIEKMKRLRPQFGFILLNGLCIAVLMVHSMKWIMARSRPNQVKKGALPFNDWYEVGSQFVADGAYRGSFPSGHTATVVAIIGVAYCLIYCGKQRITRIAGVLFFVGATSLTVLMGTHRVMTGAHWLTDVVFTFFFGWIVTHCLFFWGVRVPDQIKCIEQGASLGMKPYFELRLCIFLFFICFGAILISFGLRSVIIPASPWLVVLVPVGAGLCYFFGRLALQCGLTQSCPVHRQSSRHL